MNQTRGQLGGLQIGIILLAAATAVIHFSLVFPDTLFILNGLGYLALVAALYLPQFREYRSLVRWALMAYTALTVILWIAIGVRSTLAYVNKLIEIALIVLLFLEYREAGA